LSKIIQKGEYPVNTPEFINLSENLTNLIAGLLHIDPEKRLTVANVLSHPWVVPNSPISPSKLNNMRKFAILEDDEYSSEEECELKPFIAAYKDKEFYINDSVYDKINQITNMHDYDGRERISSFKEKENYDLNLSRLTLRRRMTS
jgi:serine/threonine protein kinase